MSRESNEARILEPTGFQREMEARLVDEKAPDSSKRKRKLVHGRIKIDGGDQDVQLDPQRQQEVDAFWDKLRKMDEEERKVAVLEMRTKKPALFQAMIEWQKMQTEQIQADLDKVDQHAAAANKVEGMMAESMGAVVATTREKIGTALDVKKGFKSGSKRDAA